MTLVGSGVVAGDVGRRRRWWPWAAGAASAGAAVVGDRNPGNWVAVDLVLGHPYVYGALACCLFATGAGLGMPDARRFGLVWRAVVAVGGVIVGGVALMFGPVFSSWYGWHETQRIAAPEGRPYRVVVKEGSDLDTYWIVYLEGGDGLARRRWAAACLDDDNPDNGLTGITWAAADRIRLTTEGAGAFAVRVGRDGRPSPAGVPAEFRC